MKKCLSDVCSIWQWWKTCWKILYLVNICYWLVIRVLERIKLSIDFCSYWTDHVNTCNYTGFVRLSALCPVQGKLEMWASAQRDGRPAECRWHPVFNAANFGWRPLLEYHAVTLPRRKTRWNLQGCPKLANRSQWLVNRCSPYCDDVERRCCLTSFFQLSIRVLVAKI